MIISDSTALITLINIEEFDLLKFFTHKIVIPIEVYEEISIEEKDKRFLDAQIETRSLEVMTYENKLLFNELNILLDKGESASIALALEKNLPLLIDEKKGRSVAQNMGIEIIGLIGVLRFLYRNDKITKKRTEEILEKLDNSSFRVSKKLVDMVLKQSKSLDKPKKVCKTFIIANSK